MHKNLWGSLKEAIKACQLKKISHVTKIRKVAGLQKAQLSLFL